MSDRFKKTVGAFRASRPGRAFIQGVGESLGWAYEKGASQGFMGWKLPKGGPFAGGLSGIAGRALFPLMTAFGAYQGYKEGGVFGAAKSVAADAAMWGGLRAAAAVLTTPALIAAGGVGSIAYGTYALGEAAKSYVSRSRNLEMSSDVVDTFGTLNTMRQRSISAIQNTHINGRLAMGNEALLLASHYRR
jgi:hypothetical protein